MGFEIDWTIPLGIIGLLALYLTGTKPKAGFGLNLGVQVPWIVYAVTHHAYGLGLTAVVSSVIFIRHLTRKGEAEA